MARSGWIASILALMLLHCAADQGRRLPGGNEGGGGGARGSMRDFNGETCDNSTVNETRVEKNFTSGASANQGFNAMEGKCQTMERERDGQKEGMQVDCNINESALIYIYEDETCSGETQEYRMMDKDEYNSQFRTGGCSGFKKLDGAGQGTWGGGDGGQSGGGGQTGQGGGRQNSGYMKTENIQQNELPDCGTAFRGNMSSYTDNSCANEAPDTYVPGSNTVTPGTQKYGVRNEAGNDGNFGNSRCQKVRSEGGGDRPKNRGMKMDCNSSDMSLSLKVYDSEDCQGTPTEERKMSRDDATSFREGRCGGFKNSSDPDATTQGFMMKEDMSSGGITIPDCANNNPSGTPAPTPAVAASGCVRCVSSGSALVLLTKVIFGAFAIMAH